MNTRIGFSTTKAWVSRLIRFFTGAAVSHAWLLYFDVEFGREMVLEATLEGVRIVPLDVFQKQNVVVKIALPRKDLAAGLLKAGELLGERYDFFGLFGMLWVLIGHWLKRKWHNPWNTSQAMFCSEFVAQVLKWSDYPGTDYWDVSAISPEDLYTCIIKDETHAAQTP